jgi:Tol biopolymer transport system component
VALAAAAAVGQDWITRVSVDLSGEDANGASYAPAFSEDGLFVAFDSDASDLVAGDANGTRDVFVRDLPTGVTVRVSVDSSGVEGDRFSSSPSISADGRFVAFHSRATNLVAGDGNRRGDVFVHDLSSGTTTRVSVDSSGVEGDKRSEAPSISGDGRYVAFESDATNLVLGDTNDVSDVFVHDLITGTTARVSVDAAGVQADKASYDAAISSDGRIVAFVSEATNLSATDGDAVPDVYVHDVSTGVTTLVSVDSFGLHGNSFSFSPVLNADGQSVAFWSLADNLVPGDSNSSPDVFVRDRGTGVTVRVSVDSAGTEASGGGIRPSLSSDGRIVAFVSSSDDLVPGDTGFGFDVFVHDRTTGLTTIASANCAGAFGNGSSGVPSLSGDGRLVAFESAADNLVSDDANLASDVFLHDPAAEIDASWSNYGSGFPGTLGVPDLVAASDPVLGTTVTIDVDNSLGAWTIGFLLAGFSEASIPTNLGGTLLVDDLFLFLPFPISSIGAAISGDLPADPDLCGLSLYLQILELDDGASKGVSFTPGLELLLGH